MPNMTKNTNPDPRISGMLGFDVGDHLPGNMKTCYSEDPVSAESETRWVNRLKRSAPDLFAQHAKSSRLELTDSSPKEKTDCTSGETINHSMVALELKEDYYMKAVSSDQFASLPNDFWIRRWLHNPAIFPQKKEVAIPITESGISVKRNFHSEKKRCPSIGAMALMGKALNGCWSCDFKKSGALVVWNTKRV